MPKGSIPRSRSGRIMDYLANRSNIGRPFRAVKGLIDDPPSLTGPIRKQDIERTFDAASFATAGSMAARRPPGSLGTGGRQYKVSGATPKTKVTQPKPGTSKFIGPVKPKATSKTKAQAIALGSPAKPSAPRYAVSGAQQTYTGAPKPGSSKFIGPTRATQPGEKGFIGPIKPPKSGEAGFIGPVRPTPNKKKISTVDKALIGTGYAGAAASVGTVGYIKATDYLEGKSKSTSKSAKVVTAVRPETPGSYMPKRSNRKYDTAIGPQKPMNTVRPETPGSYMPKKKSGGVNQITMGQSNAAAKAKKKTGATTSAAPAKPKRRTNLERMRKRQAERFAISSSGRPL